MSSQGVNSHRSLYSRITRRETHSPRSAVAIGLAVVVILLLVWIGVEAVLALINAPALLVAPSAIFSALLGLGGLAQAAPAALIAAGAVAAIIGALLILTAVLPGRRARHPLASERCAVVVDDNVIASAIARRVSVNDGLHPDQVKVYLGRRSVDVRVTPSSGLALDREQIRETAAQEIAAYDLRLRTKVIVAESVVA